MRARRAFSAILDPTLIAITNCGVCTARTFRQQDGAVWRRCHYIPVAKPWLSSIDVCYHFSINNPSRPLFQALVGCLIYHSV